MRQRSGTHHQAQHQGEEVLALLVGLLVVLGLGLGNFFRRGIGVGFQQLRLGALARERLGVGLDRGGLGLGAVSRLLPGFLGLGRVSREILDRFFRRLDRLGIGCRRGLEVSQLHFDLGLLFSQVGGATGFQRLQLGFRIFLLLLEDRADFGFGLAQNGVGIIQLLFLVRHLLQRLTVGDLRDRVAGMLHRQPHHRDHVGDDQDDVLRHLGPGHRAHAAEEGAHQMPARPTNTPTWNSRPVKRLVIRPTP